MALFGRRGASILYCIMSCHAYFIVLNGHVFIRVLSIRIGICMCVLTNVSINY